MNKDENATKVRLCTQVERVVDSSDREISLAAKIRIRKQVAEAMLIEAGDLGVEFITNFVISYAATPDDKSESRMKSCFYLLHYAIWSSIWPADAKLCAKILQAIENSLEKFTELTEVLPAVERCLALLKKKCAHD
jgi:hypothetical protein